MEEASPGRAGTNSGGAGAPSVALDLPGRGSSPADLSTVTVADFVASVVADLVDHDRTDVTLVGHSMAGLTLPGVAEAVPGRIRRLVFVSCAVPPHGVPLVDVLGGFGPTDGRDRRAAR